MEFVKGLFEAFGQRPEFAAIPLAPTARKRRFYKLPRLEKLDAKPRTADSRQIERNRGNGDE